MNVKTIFFDLGETLIELSSIYKSKSTVLQQYLSIAENRINDIVLNWGHLTYEYFMKIRQKDFLSIKEMNRLGLQQALNKEKILLSKEKISVIVDAVWDDFVNNSKLYPDVRKSINELISKGYKLGLITDSDRDIVDGILQIKHISQLFSFLVVSSDVKMYKPSTKIFEYSMKLTGNYPHEILYVGDSAMDIKGAKETGFWTAIIHRETVLPHPPIAIKPDFTITDLSQITEILVDKW